jgi:hypothetical protein
MACGLWDKLLIKLAHLAKGKLRLPKPPNVRFALLAVGGRSGYSANAN